MPIYFRSELRDCLLRSMRGGVIHIRPFEGLHPCDVTQQPTQPTHPDNESASRQPVQRRHKNTELANRQPKQPL